MSIENKQKFKLRKSKKYKNLCSVALGLIVATAIGLTSDKEAHASENTNNVATTENPATNLEYAQESQTEQAKNSQSKENEKAGNIDVNVDSTELEKAVAKAKENNLEVTRKEDVNVETNTLEETKQKQEEIKKEYLDKTTEINNKVAEYNNELAKQEAKNEKIRKDNDEKTSQYEKDLAKYEQDKKELTNKLEQGEGVRLAIESVEEPLYSPFSGITHEGGNIKWQGSHFTLETIQDDGKGHFETGYLEGHVNFTTKYNEQDKSTQLVLVSVTFDRFRSEITRQNTAVAKNHTFNYTDPQGNSIFSYTSDGMNNYGPFEINKTFDINKTITLRPNEVSEAVLIAVDQAQWIVQSKGYVYVTLSYKPELNIPSIIVPPTLEKEDTTPIPKPSLNYKIYNLSSKPNIEKEVKNTENVNINNSLVNKGSEVVWELKTETLPKGREETKEIKFIDSLPSGYDLNIEKTTTENKNYNVEYNKDTHTITLTSKDVSYLNKNLNEEIGIIIPKLYGTVLNDGAVYKNNYKLIINDYEVYSNIVKVITPGDNPTPETPDNSFIKPTKENTNKDGVNIDGKTLLPDSINYYKLLWDLDQYKDIHTSKEDVAKGFYYIDDYPEAALEPNLEAITMIDSEGQAVEGIKVATFENIEKATDEVKGMLEKAKIKPKGAFQIFTAENPEDFFNKYVVKGKSITITNPMTVKEAFVGEYQNKAYQIDFGNGYDTDVVVNNIVTPEPTKHNTEKNGIVIDGKTLLPKTVNYYKHLWDLDQYKDIHASKEDVAKGFYYIDDYPEEALEPNLEAITMIDSEGQAVEGIKVETFESVEKATDEVKVMLEKAKIKPKGAFQVIYATNPKDFFTKYVEAGETLEITTPMTLKEDYTGTYQNKAYQIDFGNGYETEIVVNHVPKINPEKDIVIDVSSKDTSLNNQIIEQGTIFNYYLKGGLLPNNRGVKIKQYDFLDDYNEQADEYNGVYKVFSTVDIKLLDGITIPKQTELTKYMLQTIDIKKGIVNVRFDKQFLSKIDNDSKFQAEIYLQMKRITSGEVENTFINTINGVNFKSNTVKTTTPEPPKPKKEKPKKLPKTSVVKKGTEDVKTTNIAMAGTLALGTLVMVRRKDFDKITSKV